MKVSAPVGCSSSVPPLPTMRHWLSPETRVSSPCQSPHPPGRHCRPPAGNQPRAARADGSRPPPHYGTLSRQHASPPCRMLFDICPQEIRHGNDAFQRVIVTHYGETTKLFLEENLPSFQHRRGATHGHHIGAHDLPHAQLVQQVGQLMLSHIRCV